MKFRTFALLLVAVALLIAGNPVATSINRNAQWPPQGTHFSYGGPFEVAWQAVPTSLTDLDSYVGNARLLGYCIYNPSGGAITFIIQTKDTSPLALPMSGSVAAGTSACFNAPFGLLSTGGVSVQAGGAGMYYSAVWTH